MEKITTKHTFKRVLCAVLAAATMFAFSACSRNSDPSSSADPDSSSTSSSSSVSKPVEKPSSSVASNTTPVAPPKTVKDQVSAAKEKNSDVVGWIKIPNTEIDNEVLQANDNIYYERRDITKSYNWYGCYYADAGNKVTTRKELSPNTIIYGHNMDDKPTGKKFAQLMKYLDADFAKNNPYIYLTTEDDEMIFQVFAVFYADIWFPYNLEDPSLYFKAGDPKAVTMKDIIAGAKERSEFIYDVDVNDTDKILTLSTCTYKFGSNTENPNQRFVVQGRLLRAGEEVKNTVSVTKNPSPKAPEFK